MNRPDVARVLGGLKDFQRQTVEHVFRRMYLDDDQVRRFLLADEVGLGKTLVTRGVAALAVDHLWDTPERIDVVYICSNNDIARQNVNRLRLSDDDEFTLATRITLLPVQIDSLRNRRLNFVSFTPGTSFDLKSRMGIAEERVLLYRLLRERWGLEGKASIEIFRGDVEAPRFKNYIVNHEDGSQIDERIAGDFGAAMARDSELHERYSALLAKVAANRDRLADDSVVERRELIADLRALLSETCLEALEPDLIILDEFQRFKHLLTGEDDASRLARRLFNYSNGKTKTRLLLVSATPYKMYSVADDLDSDDHYRDFIATVDFLTEEAGRTAVCKGALSDYHRALLRLPDDGPKPLHLAKDTLEAELRRVMVRTERLAASEDRDGMLAEFPCERVALSPDDAVDFVHLERLAEKLDEPGTLEYWKSAPYVLSFMDQYNLKRAVTDARDAGGEEEGRISDALRARPDLSLSWPTIEAYKEVGARSPRLRWLAGETIGRGAWQLLWMPPSKPSYKLGGVYGEASLTGFTKRLVFSSWHVVPKAIASMLSYEVERLIMTGADPAVENTAEARKKRRALLKFTRTKEKQVTAMPSMSLFYPSFALAELGDPRSTERGSSEWTSEGWVAEVGVRIDRALQELPGHASTGGAEDDNWYWAAPVLLDLEHNAAATRAWLGNVQLAADWAGKIDDAKDEDDADESSDAGWRAHVEQLKSVDRARLGKPPADLAEVLARVAIASPGVASLRALSRIAGGRRTLSDPTLRLSAAQLGWGFRTLFSSPEVMSLLRGEESRIPFWKLVLQYSVDGDLSAVLEEYAHVLREALGHGTSNRFEAASDIARHIRQVLSMRTSTLEVDSLASRAGRRVSLSRHRMRTRFAMRFGEQTADEVEAGRLEGGQVERTRATQVRDAFNSPFWPFVLASTSVGQEGLDFHQYCHAVVHWNLPNNPVDLEQREGRVHRYKGHAVRKNIARGFGDHGKTITGDRELADPWEAMFRAARAANAKSSELVPYWILPVEGGAKIERYVPALPLSRDRARYASLVRSLAIYRMAFGQSRQEDMVEYLLRTMPMERISGILAETQVDLSPPVSTESRTSAVTDESVWLPRVKAGTAIGPTASRRIVKPPKGEQLDRVRNDWHAAKQVFEAALPDASVRRAVQALLAESIRAAHGVSPSGWAVTLFAGGNAYLRLNVARIELFVLKSDERYRLKLIVRPSVLPKETRDMLFKGTSTYMERGKAFDSEPNARVVRIVDADLVRCIDVTGAAHLAMVRQAASHVRTRSAWAKQHSPGVVDYLVRENLEVPTPVY
jgi:hypothetical protein